MREVYLDNSATTCAYDSVGELVKKVADMAALLGRPVASPAQARAILNLNP